MTSLRLFGQDIKVEEEEKNKNIMLFGKRIFPHATLKKNKKKKKKHYTRPIDKPYLPPRSMCAAIRCVGGSGLIYIGCKDAECSDINTNLSRLLFPATYYTELLDNLIASGRENQDNDTGLEVSVMDPQGNLHAMTFNRWKSLDKFVLNRGWNKLVADNGLQKGDTVHLWHFKTPNYPCFAINIIKN